MGRESLDAQQRSAVEYWKRFANVAAVKNKRIYVIPPDTVSRLGPRLYDGAEMIARCVQPGLFGE
jgi:ABC-type Fe3+-hydroxamate transport system substrate-binding protein